MVLSSWYFVVWRQIFGSVPRKLLNVTPDRTVCLSTTKNQVPRTKHEKVIYENHRLNEAGCEQRCDSAN